MAIEKNWCPVATAAERFEARVVEMAMGGAAEGSEAPRDLSAAAQGEGEGEGEDEGVGEREGEGEGEPWLVSSTGAEPRTGTGRTSGAAST